jgi:hypothetical protein
MDTENCPEYLFLSIESLSGPSTNTAFDGGCSDPFSLLILDSQVDAEVSILFGCGVPLYPLIPILRHTPLISVHHYILLFSPLTQRLRQPTLKSPSLPVVSTMRTYCPHVLRKRTPARQRSTRYECFLNPPETFDLTQ